MSSPVRTLMLISTASLLPFALAACGTAEDNSEELAELDASLTDPSGDPAANAALADQILVDPNLTDQANTNAVRAPGTAADGAIPPGTSFDGAADAGRSAAQAELAKGRLLAAPTPRQMTSDDECSSCGGADGATLGARAEAQAAQRGKGSCNAKVSYDMAWAQRMPPEFSIYPRANVREAAGVEGGLCDLRVVSFTTPVTFKDVADYYYTKAKAGGFSAEYLLRGGEHVLGGVREYDDAAFVITMNQRGSLIEVDIVASNGR